MEEIRSFIAIELPEAVKLNLSQLEAQLKSGRQTSVKWVAPESIHLTLKFLGNIVVESTKDIAQAMAEAAQGIPPFRLEVKDLGVFPNLQRVQVAWVGVHGEIDKLSQFQQRLDSNLLRLGFAPEGRPFTPHLTIARLRDNASPAERQALGQLIASTRFEAGAFSVDAISLMKSQLTREGPIYSRISQVALSKI
ncbi:MAG: RNA 2',3'-cyclic phosphodiesterase [Dehalococcoidales bacterium]|nr:RNA 2',3'-cyclic phosphodiesterase [Dehalococcoidales bacterium]